MNEECQQSQLLLLSSIETFDPTIRAIVEARLKNIEQRAQQIINFIHEPSTPLSSLDNDVYPK